MVIGEWKIKNPLSRAFFRPVTGHWSRITVK